MNNRINWDEVQKKINETAEAKRKEKAAKDDVQVIPTTDLHRYLAKTYKHGNFFKFFRDFVKFLNNDIELAVFLQDLINRESMLHRQCMKWVKNEMYKKCRQTIDKYGFFACSNNFLSKEKYISWTVYQQKKHFKALTELKLVELVMKKEPRRRWIRINYLLIEQYLDRISGTDNMRNFLDE